MGAEAARPNREGKVVMDGVGGSQTRFGVVWSRKGTSGQGD